MVLCVGGYGWLDVWLVDVGVVCGLGCWVVVGWFCWWLCWYVCCVLGYLFVDGWWCGVELVGEDVKKFVEVGF